MYPKLKENTMNITSVAMGREKADLIIKNVNIVNTCTREINKNQDIVIINGLIALVGDSKHIDSYNTIDGIGYYASPGFMDGHMHIESSMLTVEEYSKAVLKKGTTSIFYDPHEIANVMGKEGIDFMIEASKNTPLRCFLTVPSCVPAVKDFEDNGATLTADDLKEYLEMDECVGLGEMMDIYGIIENDKECHKKLKYTYDNEKVVTGHFTLQDNNKELDAYVGTGINSCHESVTEESLLAKMRKGMYAQIRQGSAWQDLKEVITAITEKKVSSRFACLVSDDMHPNTLIEKGHMNYIINMAIEEGVNPVEAIEMATINTANSFKMGHVFGSISPSKVADIVLFKDIDNIEVDYTIISGKIIYRKDIELDFYTSKLQKNTMNISKTFTAEDFKIECNENPTVNVIEIIENKAINKHIKMKLDTKDEIKADVTNDLAKIFVIERHSDKNSYAHGLVKGFKLKKGAIATTVGHDAHNLTVIGMNDNDMSIAVENLKAMGGGMIAVDNGEIIGKVRFDIAGLMSSEKIEEVSKELETMEEAWVKLGSDISSPFMTMGLTPLAVIPEIRLTNRGLIDTLKYKFINFIDE